MGAVPGRPLLSTCIRIHSRDEEHSDGLDGELSNYFFGGAFRPLEDLFLDNPEFSNLASDPCDCLNSSRLTVVPDRRSMGIDLRWAFMNKRINGMPPLSRREFLESAAAAVAAGHLPSILAQPVASTLRTTEMGPRRISANFFVLEDTCNVYLIRDGERGILIDFGSGAILKHLPSLGVTKVDWILHTHHHRDQAQGDALAVQRGIPIAVPAHERHLFEDVEIFWSSRRVFELYQVRNDFFSLTANVPVSASLY